MSRPKKSVNGWQIKGHTTKELMSIDSEELASFDATTIRKITQRLVNTMNSRIRNLGKSNIGRLSPTYKAYERRLEKNQTSGYYSLKGKSTASVISMYQSISTSLNKATSLTAFKEYRSDLYNKLGLSFENKTFEETYANEIASEQYSSEQLEQMRNEYKTDEQKFWDIYHDYEQTTKSNESHKHGGGSPEVISYIFNSSDWEKLTLEEKQKRINSLYEDLKIKESQEKNITESDIMNLAESDEDDEYYGW